MNKMRLIPLCLLIAAAAGCSDDGSSPSDMGSDGKVGHCSTLAFMPGSNDVGDFSQKTSSLAVVTTSKELDDLIDGGSETYKQNKFKCMFEVIFTSSSKSHQIKLWIFDQTDAAGASAAYAANANPDETTTTTTYGDESHENLKLPLAYQVRMRKDLYVTVVKVDDPSGKDDGRSMLKTVADKIGGGAPDSGPGDIGGGDLPPGEASVPDKGVAQ